MDLWRLLSTRCKAGSGPIGRYHCNHRPDQRIRALVSVRSGFWLGGMAGEIHFVVRAQTRIGLRQSSRGDAHKYNEYTNNAGLLG